MRKNRSIDLVLMDIRMSDMNGIEAFHEIRTFILQCYFDELAVYEC